MLGCWGDGLKTGTFPFNAVQKYAGTPPVHCKKPALSSGLPRRMSHFFGMVHPLQ
jgi:hypothetical protein